MEEESTQYRTVLSGEKTGITALALFGRATHGKAELPLITHFHKNKLEFIIMQSGMQKYIANGEHFTIYGGEAFLTYVNEPHSCARQERAENDLLWFQLDLSQRGNFLDLPPNSAEYLYTRLIRFATRRIPISKELTEVFSRSFFLLGEGEKADVIKGRALFVYALMNLLDREQLSKNASEDVMAAKLYIDEHIKEPITIADLSEQSELSASEFRDKFKAAVNLSPREYINSAKIGKARFDVALTEQSITDIAFEYSFSTVKYFTTAFKQFTGYKPRDYRKKYLSGKIKL